jgi:hypothetical protein
MPFGRCYAFDTLKIFNLKAGEFRLSKIAIVFWHPQSRKAGFAHRLACGRELCAATTIAGGN